MEDEEEGATMNAEMLEMLQMIAAVFTILLSTVPTCFPFIIDALVLMHS